MNASDLPSEGVSAGAFPKPASTAIGGQHTPFSTTPPDIPDHELIKCIGHGSFGDVWLARTIMGTYRAIKIVYRHAFDHPRPYEREFEGIRRFEPVSRRHESQLGVLQVGRNDEAGYFYYVMELADDGGSEVPEHNRSSEERAPKSAAESGIQPEGYVPKTLKLELQRRGRFSIEECLRIGLSLATALDHLHGQGLIHRDIKPSNIIFIDGLPKLADIGLISTLDATMSISGTPGYIAPEGSGTPQADVYSLGKVLYEMSMGRDRSEFPRLPEDFDVLSDRQQLLELNAVLVKAGYGDPTRRYQTAAELHADLALVRSGRSVKGLHRMERHLARFRRLAAGLALLSVVVAGAWWQMNRAQGIASRSLARMQMERGIQHVREGDHLAALPWLVEALRLEPGGRERRQIHRRRLASVLKACPRPVALFMVPDAPVLDADISADGDRVATAHYDGRVRVWDVGSAKPPRELIHALPVHFCKFLPVSDQLLTSTFRREALLWDVDSGDKHQSALAHFNRSGRGRWYGLSVNYTDRRVCLALNTFALARTNQLPIEAENLRLHLSVTGDKEGTRIRYQIRSLSPDGKTHFEAEFVDTPRFDTLEYGREADATPIQGPVWFAVWALGEGSNGNQPPVSRVGWDNFRIRSYPSQEGPPSTWQHEEDFSETLTDDWLPMRSDRQEECRTEDGRLALAVGQQGIGGGAYLVPFEVREGQTVETEIDLVEATEGVRSAEFVFIQPPPKHDFDSWDPVASPDGRRLAVASRDGVLQIWDLAAGQFLRIQTEEGERVLQLQHGSRVTQVDFSNDGRLLAAVTQGKSRVVVWDLETGQQLPIRLPAEYSVLQAQFSPDGRWLALNLAYNIALVRVDGWRLVETLSVGGPIGQIAFSPVGQRLAFVRDNRWLSILDLDKLTAPPIEVRHDFDIERIEFAPDGHCVAVDTKEDGVVRVWNVTGGQQALPPLRGDLGRFSSDGSQLLLISPDTGAWLWELSELAPDEVLSVPPAVTRESRAFSPDYQLKAVVAGSDVAIEGPDWKCGPLSHLSPVKRAWFSAASDYLVAETRDMRSWLWEVKSGSLVAPPMAIRYDVAMDAFPELNLPGDTRSERTLAEMATLLSGQRPDGNGGSDSVPPRMVQGLFNRLRENFQSDFSRRTELRRTWHARQAGLCEREQEWTAACFHWAQLREMSPDDAALETRWTYAHSASDLLRAHIYAGESRASFCPPRPPWATTNMLDLSSFYTLSLREDVEPASRENSFGRLPSGIQRFRGIDFDVRGMIELRSGETVRVPIHRACRRLHFLHAARSGPGFSTELGAIYRLTFAAGDVEEVEVSSPADLTPYRTAPFHRTYPGVDAWSSPGLNSTLAWAGTNPDAASRDETLFLSRTTWELPADRRNQLAEVLELSAGSTSCQPLVFAVTVE